VYYTDGNDTLNQGYNSEINRNNFLGREGTIYVHEFNFNIFLFLRARVV
jgi:hypothetical protein